MKTQGENREELYYWGISPGDVYVDSSGGMIVCVSRYKIDPDHCRFTWLLASGALTREYTIDRTAQLNTSYSRIA